MFDKYHLLLGGMLIPIWLVELAGLVASAGSFILGLGILGALIAYVLSTLRERRQRDRELKGLLRLLDLEIQFHGRDLDQWEVSPRGITRSP